MSTSMVHPPKTIHQSLKKPDSFKQVIQKLLDRVSTQSGRIVLGIGILFFLGLGGALWMNHQDAQDEASRNALYLAEKSLAEETKKAAPNSSPNAEVDTQWTHSIELFKIVESRYPSTRAALEARIKLAGLYWTHKDYPKALTWYQKANDTASGFDKAATFSALGYTYENLGKPGDAIQAYEKAINLGQNGLKADLLLGIARSYEAAHDLAKARSTYDQILRDFPSTEASRSAQIRKDQLQ